MASVSPQLVDQIVRDILRELRSGGDRASAGADGAAGNGADGTIAELLEPVVTGEMIEQVDASTKGVRVAPKSILTPTALDVLRHRGLRVERGAAQAEMNSAAGGLWVARTGAAAGAAETVSAQAGWAKELAGDTGEAVTRSVAELCRGGMDRAIVVVADAFAAACEANRNQSIYAVAAVRVEDFAAALEQMKVNLLCLDAERVNPFEARRIVQRFVATGNASNRRRA